MNKNSVQEATEVDTDNFHPVHKSTPWRKSCQEVSAFRLMELGCFKPHAHRDKKEFYKGLRDSRCDHIHQSLGSPQQGLQRETHGGKTCPSGSPPLPSMRSIRVEVSLKARP